MRCLNRGIMNLLPRIVAITLLVGGINSLGVSAYADSGPVQLPGTNHWYEYVGQASTWTDARAIAASHSLSGVAGHLVTIGSEAENGFVADIGGGAELWLGARNIGPSGSLNRNYAWDAGPESGTVITSCPGSTSSPSDCSFPSGIFASWHPAEPNGNGGDTVAVKTNYLTRGAWDDCNLNERHGFVIEYEPAAIDLPITGLGAATGIATSRSGLVAVSDYSAGLVHVYDRTGEIHTYTGLNHPHDVGFANDGTLYVAMFGSRNAERTGGVARISVDGDVDSSWWTGMVGSGGVAVDAVGQVWASDSDGGAVYVRHENGQVDLISGPWSGPHGLRITATGSLLVADYSGAVYERLSNGVVNTRVTGHSAVMVQPVSQDAFYFSSQREGNVYFCDSEGRLTLVASGLPQITGVALSEDKVLVSTWEANRSVTGFPRIDNQTIAGHSAPGTPEITAVNANSSSLTVRWTRPAVDGGAINLSYAVKTYDLGTQEVTTMCVTGGDSCTFQMPSSHKSQVLVTATNSAGESADQRVAKVLIPSGTYPYPMDAKSDSHGNIYVPVSDNAGRDSHFEKVTPTGIRTRIFDVGFHWWPDNVSLAITPDDKYMYFTDQNSDPFGCGYRLVKVDLATMASQEINTGLCAPNDVAIDSNGHVYLKSGDDGRTGNRGWWRFDSTMQLIERTTKAEHDRVRALNHQDSQGNTISYDGSYLRTAKQWIVDTRTVPSAPQLVSASAMDARALVSWSPSASDGGSAITRYKVSTFPSGGHCEVEGNSCLIRGLTNGQRYRFRVIAVNEIGDSEPSGWSIGVMPEHNASGGQVVQVSAGGDHTCAVLASGDLRCWGADTFGQADVPSDVGLVKSVSVNNLFTCVVTAVDMVRCWGNNEHGQVSVPDDLGLVRSVFATWRNACALTQSNTVRCWGTNDYGQISGANGFSPATGIFGASHDTCALDMNRLAHCWGVNFWGSMDVPGDLGPALGLDLGWLHGCAINTSHQLRCWGDNRYGQVSVPADLQSVEQVQASWGNTCVVSMTHDVRCWGENSWGQSNVPSDLQLAESVSITWTHACIVTLGGRVRCWGSNSSGESNVPVDLQPQTVPIVTSPSTPQSPTATAGDGQATVVWSVPESDGGASIIDYTVTASPGGATCTTVETSCTVVGLSNRLKHTFTVTARNKVGVSDMSAASNSVTPLAPGLQIWPENRSVAIGDSATVWVAGASRNALVVFAYAGSKQVVQADSDGFARLDLTMEKARLLTVTARVGRMSMRTALYTPKTTTSLRIRRGRPCKVSISYGAPNSVVAVGFNDGRVITSTLNSRGTSSLSARMDTPGSYQIVVTVDAVVVGRSQVVVY